MSCCKAFSSSSVLLCAFSALCMNSKSEHHPHPLDYLWAKFCFFCGLHCWASPRRKITNAITQSINHPTDLMCREPKLLLWNCLPIWPKSYRRFVAVLFALKVKYLTLAVAVMSKDVATYLPRCCWPWTICPWLQHRTYLPDDAGSVFRHLTCSCYHLYTIGTETQFCSFVVLTRKINYVLQA